MPSRICRCVNCPACHTRYAMRSTAYPNGACVEPHPGAVDLFTLHCSCRYSHLFKLSQLQTYTLTDAAYLGGYGSTHEIVAKPRAARVKAS